MADIELVIKIPEELYNDIKEQGLCGYCSDREIISEAIGNGTPLPKGHGRLVDVDKMLDEMRATKTYDIPFALERVKPIIEADKGENK